MSKENEPMQNLVPNNPTATGAKVAKPATPGEAKPDTTEHQPPIEIFLFLRTLHVWV